MQYSEIIEGVTRVWSRTGNKSVMKYRCMSGVRKGRVMASPAACNAPINVSKSTTLKRTKSRRGSVMTYKSGRTKKTNPASKRLKQYNKPRVSQGKGRKI